MTFGFGNQHSIQLSYGRASFSILPRRRKTRPSAFPVLEVPRYNARLVSRGRIHRLSPLRKP